MMGTMKRSYFARPSFSVTLFLLLVTHVSFVLSQSCPRGTFRGSDGSCQLCSPGSFSDSENAQTCKLCDAGRFLKVYGAQTESACRACPPGTFSTEGAAECTPCPRGFNSPQRSSRCVQCPPGSQIALEINDGTSDCIPCTNLGYSSLPSQLQCNRCPLGAVAPRGATSARQCFRCLPGSAPSHSGSHCVPCEEGTFSSDGVSCRQCPIGTRSVGTGNTRCEPCPPGFYGIEDPLFHNNRCDACPNGTKTFGTVSVLCKREGSPCPSTYFENEAGDCVWCPVDSFYDAERQRCEPCPSGFGSPGGLSLQCSPCADIINSLVTDSLCYRTINYATPADENGDCPPGTYISEEDGRTCSRCGQGTFSDTANSVGVFNPISGTFGCKLCPSGSVPQSPVASICKPCPPGTEPDEYAEKCVVPQTMCELGSSLIEQYPGVVTCMSDTCNQVVGFEDFKGRRCGTCDVGHYAPEPFTCQGCPANSVGDGLRCALCPDGLVRFNDQCGCRGIIAQNRGIIDGRCQVCPPGSFGEWRGLETDNICRKCPAGTYRTVTSDDAIAQCIGFGRCFPGQPCQRCPVDSFTDADGAIECKPCPPGTFTYGVGDTECLVPGAVSRFKQIDKRREDISSQPNSIPTGDA